MKSKPIVLCIVAALLLSGCGHTSDSENVSDQPTNQPVTEESTTMNDNTIASGTFEQYTENNFTEAIDYELTTEDIASINDALTDATLANEALDPGALTYEYVLTLYNSRGEEQYMILFEDNVLTTNDGYVMDCPRLLDWITTAIKTIPATKPDTDIEV